MTVCPLDLIFWEEDAMNRRILCVASVAACLLLVGCSKIIESDRATVLRFSMTAIIGLLGAGIALFVGGVLLTIKRLPRRWREQQSLRRKLRSASRILVVPVVGIMFLVLVMPFAWYRVEVGSDYLRLSEFPHEMHLTREQIERIEVIPGASDRRLRIETKEGEEYFVNEGEVGEDSFSKISMAALKLVETKQDEAL